MWGSDDADGVLTLTLFALFCPTCGFVAVELTAAAVELVAAAVELAAAAVEVLVGVVLALV